MGILDILGFIIIIVFITNIVFTIYKEFFSENFDIQDK
jgi:hypothetical protein